MPALKLTGDKVPPNFDNKLSKWYFETKVIVGLNSNAHDVILLAQHRLESANLVLQIESLYSASNPSVRWTDAIDLAKFTTLLVGARDDLSSNLRELTSFKLASEDIARNHGEGHCLMLGDFTAKIEDLYEKTVASTHEFERTRGELLSTFDISGTELPQELLEIDFDTIEKLAVNEGNEMARMLVDSATRQMLIAFEQPEALEGLGLEVDLSERGRG